MKVKHLWIVTEILVNHSSDLQRRNSRVDAISPALLGFSGKKRYPVHKAAQVARTCGQRDKVSVRESTTAVVRYDKASTNREQSVAVSKKEVILWRGVYVDAAKRQAASNECRDQGSFDFHSRDHKKNRPFRAQR